MSERYLLISGSSANINRVMGLIWGDTHDGLQVEINGVYLKTEKYCECPPKQRQNMKNWVPAKKWGIPICRNCKRPSRYWVEGIKKRLAVALGNSELGDTDGD